MVPMLGQAWLTWVFRGRFERVLAKDGLSSEQETKKAEEEEHVDHAVWRGRPYRRLASCLHERPKCANTLTLSNRLLSPVGPSCYGDGGGSS